MGQISNHPKTLGELKSSGYKVLKDKNEINKNFDKKLKYKK